MEDTFSIQEYQSVLSSEEMEDLNNSFVGITRSKVVDNGDNVVSDARTSDGVRYLGVHMESIKRKIASLLGASIDRMDHLQLIEYDVGQYYLPHYDNDDDSKKEFTVIIYLNDGFEGGLTRFPAINRVVEPSKGLTIAWRNLRKGREEVIIEPPMYPPMEGATEPIEHKESEWVILPESLHESTPVISGKKKILLTCINTKK